MMSKRCDFERLEHLIGEMFARLVSRQGRRCGAVPEGAWIPTHSYFFGKSSVKFTRNPQSGPPSGFSA